MTKVIQMKRWGNTQAVMIPQKILREAGIYNLYADYEVTTNSDEHTITLREVKTNKKVIKTVRKLKH